LVRSRTLVRLTAEDIAERRSIVDEMSRLGHGTGAIADAILRNPSTRYLLDRQTNAKQVIRDDRRRRREERQEATAIGFGLPAISEYIEHHQALRELLWRELLVLPKGSPRRIQVASLLRLIDQDIAIAKGVEVGQPLVKFNWVQLLGQSNPDIAQHLASVVEGQVLARGPSASLKVDALTFATSEDFCNLNLDDKPMERQALSEFMRAGSGYNELVDICGMRSGKGTVGSVIVWFMVYQLLELADPQRYYGLAAGQTIGTLNMAMSQEQARKQVFKHCIDRVETGGRWFQELSAFCDRHLQSWKQVLSMQLPKNILMQCGHSSAKTQVGGTNICAVFDELCKFKTNEGKDNAESVYSQIKATTATFGEDSRVVTLSSPEWEGDYGMQLLTMAKERDDSPLNERCDACRSRAEAAGSVPSPAKSHPRMMAIHLPSWEANLSLTFEHLWETQNGAANPRAFWRDFGARPSTAKEGYYPNPERWDHQGDADLFYPYVEKAGRILLREDWAPCCESRRFVHVDLAVSRDSCGMAMAHKPVPGCPWYDKPDEDGNPNPKGRKVVVDLALQVRPQAPAPGQAPEISFEDVRDYIRDWQDRGFRIKSGRVTYDGWQSIDSRQILRKEGYRVEEFSLDRNLDGHDTLQELINTDQLAYFPHPVLVREAKALEFKGGRKVDHPPNGSKDVVDAVAGAVYHAYRYGGRTKFIGG